MARMETWERNRDRGVPLEGGKAFAQGWTLGGCPWPWDSLQCRFWYAGWWLANAEAFKSHVEGV